MPQGAAKRPDRAQSGVRRRWSPGSACPRVTRDTRFARVRARLAASILGLLTAACAPPRSVVVDPQPIAIAASRPPAVAPTVEAPRPPPPRLGPFRRESPILFQPSAIHAAITPVARSVRSWAASTDGAARVELGCRSGVRVVDAGGTRAVGADADRVAIAADGAEIAREHAGRIARIDPTTGRTRASVEGTDATYLAAGVLAFRRGCTWFTLRDDATEPTPIGDSCGQPIRSERDRPRLWLAELVPPADAGVPGRDVVAALVGLEPSATPLRLELDDAGPMYAAAISPDASIVCGTFVDGGHDVLQCRLRDGGEFERVAKDVFGTAQFADDGRRLVFTVGDRTHPPRDLHLIDFDHRIVRKLGRVAHHRLAFLPGGEHVVAFDGARGLVFELDTGWVTPFGGESDDWVALGPLDQPGGFLASRLGRRCAELVRVALPAREGGTTASP